jgi:fluoride exporter
VASYFWIAIGSALGGMARYWCSGIAARLIGETFPWGTIIVNIVGSLIIGFFATLTGPDGRIFADTLTRQFVMIGFCGCYTTFSSQGHPIRHQTHRVAVSASCSAPRAV